MRPVYIFLANVLLCALCSGTAAQEQQEGQFLHPPLLLPLDNNVLEGMTIDSVAGFPITATIDAENIRTDAHGKSVILRFRSKIYRDSKGRIRLESDNAPLGEPPKPAWDMIDIYDPTARTDLILKPSTKTGIKYLLSTPGEKLEQVCGLDNNIDPKALAKISFPQVTQRDLAHDIVDGMVVRHGRESAKVPPNYSGNNTGYKMVTDYWFSQELQAFVLVKRTGPGNSKHTIRLSDISRDEPDPSLFAVPTDYQVSQISEEGPAPCPDGYLSDPLP
jgi:hypothetical protein